LLQKISKNFQNKLQNAGHQKPAKPAALSAAFPEIYANSLINFNAFTHRLIWASPEHGGNALPANLFQDDYVSNFFLQEFALIRNSDLEETISTN
jgi:hypothetical protein